MDLDGALVLVQWSWAFISAYPFGDCLFEVRNCHVSVLSVHPASPIYSESDLLSVCIVGNSDLSFYTTVSATAL